MATQNRSPATRKACYYSKTLFANAAAHWVYAAKKITKTVIVLISICVVFDFLGAIGEATIGPTGDPNGPLEPGEVIQGITALLRLFVLIVAAVYYCMWVYRSVKAVSAMSKRPFPFSAGAAVGYHFIPVLSLFKPYQVMKGVFEWSTPRAEKLTSKTNTLLGVWWATWIGSNIISYALLRTPEPMLDLVSTVLSMVAGVALIILVKELPQLQERRLAEWQTEQAPPVGEFVEYPRYPDPSVTSG